MGKTTVFSWKLNDNEYGYLWTTKHPDTPCITSRITSPSELESIVNEVSNWTAEQYQAKFNALNELIHENTGNYIEGDYTIYYNGNNGNKNYIMLTGKDGSSSNQHKDTEIESNVLSKLKTYIANQVTIESTKIKSDFNDFKAASTQEFNTFKTTVDTEINSSKEEILQSTNTLVDTKMASMSNTVKDSVLQEIPSVGTLNEIVNGARYTELCNKVDQSILSNNNKIESIRSDVNVQNTKIDSISNELNEEINAANEKFESLTKSVAAVNEKVDKVVASEIIVDEQTSGGEEALSKGVSNNEDQYILETETIDNGDGTFDIKSSIGTEEYNIKILAFGNKLKVGDSNTGLTLAPNGIKYVDKSGSFISIINGNIKLSNADGSGKLEIKKDGLYINGVKQ